MIVAWGWLAVVAIVTVVAAVRRAWPATPALRDMWDDDEGDDVRRVLILRPCTGDDAFLNKSLATWPRHADSAVMKFLVPSKSDPVFEIAERAALELRRRGVDADVLITGMVHGASNRKVAQLAAADIEEFDIVCVLDADLDLHTLDLDTMTHPLEHAAAVWLPPTECALATLGDRASTAVLAGSLHAFPLLAGIDPQGLVGKAFAVRTDALEVAGGFGAFSRRLGEDVELAKRLVASGYAVVPATGCARSIARGRSMSATIDRFARWLLVIRAQRPVLLMSYPILFFATLPLMLLFALAGSVTGVFAALGLRLFTALIARRFSGGPMNVVADALLADCVLAAAWGKALTNRYVRWRGASFRVDAGGYLVDG